MLGWDYLHFVNEKTEVQREWFVEISTASYLYTSVSEYLEMENKILVQPSVPSV